jgi:hypothetical protein
MSKKNQIPEKYLRGWEDYLRKNHNLSVNSPIIEFQVIKWGTYGKSGLEPLRWIPICELSNSHLEAIINTQYHIPPWMKWVMLDILNFRRANGDTEPETEIGTEDISGN